LNILLLLVEAEEVQLVAEVVVLVDIELPLDSLFLLVLHTPLQSALAVLDGTGQLLRLLAEMVQIRFFQPLHQLVVDWVVVGRQVKAVKQAVQAVAVRVMVELLLLAALVLQAKVMLVEHHLEIMVLVVVVLVRLEQMLQAPQLLVVLDLHLLLLALAHITLEAVVVAL
jgi:hypothetical protein